MVAADRRHDLRRGVRGASLGPVETGAVEHLPAPGLVVITGDPAEASHDLVIRYIYPDGEVSGRSTSVRAGDAIEFSGWHHPGPHRLLVNGGACSGSFPI